jgi:hypothetical protein
MFNSLYVFCLCDINRGIAIRVETGKNIVFVLQHFCENILQGVTKITKIREILFKKYENIRFSIKQDFTLASRT